MEITIICKNVADGIAERAAMTSRTVTVNITEKKRKSAELFMGVHKY